LEGKRAIITGDGGGDGGDDGIGRAVALAFAREGADVLTVCLNEDDDARGSGAGGGGSRPEGDCGAGRYRE
jgi:NAD(P)-dependent dehydrogenase (short-subunit alcohol dehydrogenase family)